MNYFDVIFAKKLGGGGGGGVTINPLSVSANGTYSAPTGTAYSPVTVSVNAGGTDFLNETLMKTISSYSNSTAMSIGICAFQSCSLLSNVTFDAVANIGSSAFQMCGVLSNVSFPAVQRIWNNAFNNAGLISPSFPQLVSLSSSAFNLCKSMTGISVPNLENMSANAFGDCYELSQISLPKIKTIANTAFGYCSKLESVYITASSLATLGGSSVFRNSPIVNSSYLGRFGSVYVPSSLLSSYKTATNWTLISDRLVGI